MEKIKPLQIIAYFSIKLPAKVTTCSFGIPSCQLGMIDGPPAFKC